MKRFSVLVLVLLYCLETNSVSELPKVRIDDPETEDLIEFGFGFLLSHKEELKESIKPICEIKKTEEKTTVSFIFKSIERYDLEWYDGCYFECFGNDIFLRSISGVSTVVLDSVECKFEKSNLYYGCNITFENKNGVCRVSEFWIPWGTSEEIDFKIVNDTCFSFTENDEWPFEKDSSIIYLDYEESLRYRNKQLNINP